MSVNYDFQIVGTNIAGISSVQPLNEEAYCYLVEETQLSVFKDGSSVLFDERVGDFMSDAGHAHLSCELV